MKWLLLVVVMYGNGKIGGPQPVPINSEEACHEIEAGINEIGPDAILRKPTAKENGGIAAFEVFCLPLYMTSEAA